MTANWEPIKNKPSTRGIMLVFQDDAGYISHFLNIPKFESIAPVTQPKHAKNKKRKLQKINKNVLVKLLGANKLTLADLETLSGVSIGTLGAVFSPTYHGRFISTIIAVTKALDCDIDTLCAPM